MFTYGDRVFFQNEQGMFWFGTVERNCFTLIMDVPIDSVLVRLSFLAREDEMYRLHEDGWFCGQEELPF
jgi:hypothetical protein